MISQVHTHTIFMRFLNVTKSRTQSNVSDLERDKLPFRNQATLTLIPSFAWRSLVSSHWNSSFKHPSIADIPKPLQNIPVCGSKLRVQVGIESPGKIKDALAMFGTYSYWKKSLLTWNSDLTRHPVFLFANSGDHRWELLRDLQPWSTVSFLPLGISIATKLVSLEPSHIDLELCLLWSSQFFSKHI